MELFVPCGQDLLLALLNLRVPEDTRISQQCEFFCISMVVNSNDRIHFLRPFSKQITFTIAIVIT
jgi:hypothetical protein